MKLRQSCLNGGAGVRLQKVCIASFKALALAPAAAPGRCSRSVQGCERRFCRVSLGLFVKALVSCIDCFVFVAAREVVGLEGRGTSRGTTFIAAASVRRCRVLNQSIHYAYSTLKATIYHPIVYECRSRRSQTLSKHPAEQEQSVSCANI
jgi:hypothetical protein